MKQSTRTFAARAKRLRDKHWPSYVFIHINKTAGSSIEQALNLPFEHKTAAEKLAELGAYRWRRAFRFSFVRNPWDKVVSHFHYRTKTNQTMMGDGHISFREWVLRAYGERDPLYYDQPKMFMPQVDWLRDASGAIIVDYIGRYERLNSDFAAVCKRIGVDRSLPRLKSSSHAGYRDYYDEQSRACIARHFCEDIDGFDYVF